MSSYIVCNGCELQISKDYAGLWIGVTIKMVDMEFQADYCPECWSREFVKKLAPVVGAVGKERDDSDSDSPDIGADIDGT